MEVEYRSANGEEVLKTRNPSLVKRAIAIKIAGTIKIPITNKTILRRKKDENLVFCHKEELVYIILTIL